MVNIVSSIKIAAICACTALSLYSVPCLAKDDKEKNEPKKDREVENYEKKCSEVVAALQNEKKGDFIFDRNELLKAFIHCSGYQAGKEYTVESIKENVPFVNDFYKLVISKKKLDEIFRTNKQLEKSLVRECQKVYKDNYSDFLDTPVFRDRKEFDKFAEKVADIDTYQSDIKAYSNGLKRAADMREDYVLKCDKAYETDAKTVSNALDGIVLDPSFFTHSKYKECKQRLDEYTDLLLNFKSFTNARAEYTKIKYNILRKMDEKGLNNMAKAFTSCSSQTDLSWSNAEKPKDCIKRVREATKQLKSVQRGLSKKDIIDDAFKYCTSMEGIIERL